MKSISTKSAAKIAMIISLVSFILMLASLITLIIEPPIERGYSMSFVFWMWGMIVAYLSLIFYFIDAVRSIIKIFKKIHPFYNAVLSIILIGAIPMALFVGGRLGICIYIWNAYYLAIFILEIVSIAKHIEKTDCPSQIEPPVTTN